MNINQTLELIGKPTIMFDIWHNKLINKQKNPFTYRILSYESHHHTMKPVFFYPIIPRVTCDDKARPPNLSYARNTAPASERMASFPKNMGPLDKPVVSQRTDKFNFNLESDTNMDTIRVWWFTDWSIQILFPWCWIPRPTVKTYKSSSA